jgi:hypothetical protein
MTDEQEKMFDVLVETYKDTLHRPDDFCDALEAVMEKIKGCDISEEEKSFWGTHCYEATTTIDTEESNAQQIAELFKNSLFEKITQATSGDEVARAGFF